MISRNFVKNNVNSVAIFIYLLTFGLITYYKPNFIYNKDGSFREFGIGTSKKTVIPIWLVAILLSLMSYFFVLYYLAFPKLNI